VLKSIPIRLKDRVCLPNHYIMVPNDPNLNIIAPTLCEKYLIYSRNA
jgi:hypothetical protein